MQLNSFNDQLELYDDRVVIKRKGLPFSVLHGISNVETTIYLDEISGIQIKKAGMISSGYIQFILPGTLSKDIEDENRFSFFSENNDLVDIIKSEIDKLKNQRLKGLK